MLTKKTSRWMRKICKEEFHLISTHCLSLRIGTTRVWRDSSPKVTKSSIMVSSSDSDRVLVTRIYMRVRQLQA